MSDIVNAFKQKASKKKANYFSEEKDPLSQIQDTKLETKLDTTQQDTNKALESAQKENISYQTNTTKASDKLAALQEAAAAEQAQNAAKAAASTAATAAATQTTTQPAKDDSGWKKYYDAEKKKVREDAYKTDQFGSWLQDVFNSGWDSRLAETNARNKYANEKINQAWDESGNVKDQNAAEEAKQITNYNTGVAKSYSDYEKARGNAIGANLATKDQSSFKSTANAIRNMDVGSAIVGSKDPEGTGKAEGLKDAGRFIFNLLPGVFTAPIVGTANLTESISGKGFNKETGLEEDLDTLSRVGRGASGFIDIAGTFFGGSGNLVKSVANTLYKKGASEVAKQAAKQTTKSVIKDITKASLQEGGEEAVQQIAEFFGDGNKIITSDGQFDQDSFNELLKETGQAAVLGTIGGGIMSGAAKGIDLANTKLNPKAKLNIDETSNINNNLIAKENAAERQKVAEETTAEKNVDNATIVKNTTENTKNETTTEPSERLKAAEALINELQNKQYNLPQNTLNDMSAKIQNISEQIRNGSITEDEGIILINELTANLTATTQANMAEPQETSATGQKVNPQDVSNVVTEAQGTQASAEPSNAKTDITENAVADNTPKLSEKMSEPAKKEQERIISNIKKTGLDEQDIVDLTNETERGIKDIYALTQANTKGKYAIDQAIKSGDTAFVKNLIRKYLKEGTYDKEINTYKQSMPSIYGVEGQIDFSPLEYEAVVDENGYRTMRKIDNPRVEILKTKIQEAKNNGRITPETLVFIKEELASNKSMDEKLSNIESIFEPVKTRTPEQEINDLLDTATEQTTAPTNETVGNITENYLQDKEYTIEEMRTLSNRVNNAAEKEANELGTTMDDIRREVNRAERAGLNTLAETELTAEQQDLYRRYLNELNAIREFGAAQGKQLAGDIGELYMPNQVLGYNENLDPLAGFNTERPGSEISRGSNRIDVEEQDFGTDPIDRYFIEHGASSQVKQERAKNAVTDITGNSAPNEVSVKEYVKLQDSVNDVSVKNPLKVKQTTSEGKKVSPTDTMNKIGQDNNVPQEDIYGRARGLTDEDKLKSVDVATENGKQTVWEAGGYYAYRQAPTWAARIETDSRTQDGMIDTDTLKAQTKEYLNSYIISDNTRKYFNRRVDNINDNLSDNAKRATVEYVLQDAARNQNMNFLTTHKTDDAKLKEVLDYQSTIMLRDNSLEKSAANKVTSAILKLQNAAFRKLNVSSALNELSDLSSMMSVAGVDFKPVYRKGIAAEYGMSEAEIDPAVMAEISPNGEIDANKLGSALKKINNGTNLYHFVEAYKMNVALSSFEKLGIKQGLTGKELSNFVTDNTRKVILPVDQFTRTFLNNYPLFTQYMPWTLRNLQKEVQLLTGSYEGGVYKTDNKLAENRGARILYNATTNLPLKTLYWLASNGLKGTAITTAFGLLEIGGDYSGIDDEDKNLYEKYGTQITGTSTIGSLINSVEYALHKEQLKEQYSDQEYNPYENENLGDTIGDIALTHFVPAGSQIKKDAQAIEMLGQGYSENKADKVQYLSPDNPADIIKSLLFGKSSTSNARDYSGNLGVLTRTQNKIDNGENAAAAFVSSIVDMAKEDTGAQERLYNRPMSNAQSSNYNEMVKNTTGEEQKQWYEKGREYNAITDNLRRNNPDAYEVYQSTFSKDIVSPEKYARIAYGNGEQTPEAIDLTVWNTMKDLALKKKEDFGANIDPAYTDLDDEQTRRYLQYKSTATGDDLILKKEMAIDPFWDEFFDKQNEYYNSLGDREYDDSAYSQRVQEWNDYNQQYGDYMKFISGKSDTMKDQQLALELSLQFPLMREYQSLKTALQKQYGDDYKSSSEYKSFWSNNYDAYQAESEAFNTQVLYLINQMRTIEGYDEMTIDQLEAINSFGKETSSNKSYSSSSSGYSYAPKFENIFSATPVYAKSYGSTKKVKPNLAGRPSFESVGLSETVGKDPYASVI